MKCNNIHIRGIPEGEEKEEGIENLFVKVMMENFPNLMAEKVTQIQETQSPNLEEPKEAHSKIHYNENGKIPRQRGNLKGSKGENGNNIQRISDKTSR